MQTSTLVCAATMALALVAGIAVPATATATPTVGTATAMMCADCAPRGDDPTGGDDGW